MPLICYNGQGAETGRYFYHRDGLGSVVALSQLSASTVQIVESYAYDIHGRVTIMDSAGADGQWLTPDVTSLAGSAVGNPYLFTGRRYDPETRTAGHSGLYYYRARVYHPDLMRFCQPDPTGYADGMNMYTYVGNSPLVLADPFGLCRRSSPSYYSNLSPWDIVKRDALRALAFWSGNQAQSMANSVQAVQDMVIGTINFATMAGFWMQEGTTHVDPRDYLLPSPQWARDRYWRQSNLSYEGEKFVKGLGLGYAVGQYVRQSRGTSGRSSSPGQVGQRVVFKSAHGARHLEGTGLTAQAVEQAISNNVQQAMQGASGVGSFWGRVSVGGRVIEYRAFPLADGTINVGTYYPVTP